MSFPLSFAGKIRPLSYALCSFGTFFSQHLIVLATFSALGEPLRLDWWFYVTPLRSLASDGRASDLVLILALVYLLVAAWVLAVLAFRRAADANVSEWIAAFAMAPIVQIPAILFLCFAPSRVAQAISPPLDQHGAPVSGWAAAAQGVVVGMGLTVLAVVLGALVFGVYRFGMFVVSPFVIGATTAYFANRQHDIGASRTAQLVLGAAALGGIALVVAALEGIVCIILASPLAAGAALIGGALGRAVALHTRRSPAQTLSGFALLPLVFAIENVLPATTNFDTYQTIEVNAPPELVWKSIVHMDTIDAPLALPFRLGVAYPVRGDVIGEGVGALRRGEFSTGTAFERVTEWIANQKLALVVLNDIPAMRELSPYQHVHAPHVIGYFSTTSASFELLPRPGGLTGIVERTSHELRLDPVLYWLPLARWVVRENNARVLAHIRREAERKFTAGG
jgi:uncharacterized membrane protein YhaH (DUF805 family)